MLQTPFIVAFILFYFILHVRTALFTEILEHREGHFLSLEGARMQDFTLKFHTFSQNYAFVPRAPKTCCFLYGSPKVH